jgi:hypothetical protein
MLSPTAQKNLSRAGIALAIFPLLVLVLFYAYVVRARMAFGFWPSYGHPESWSIGFDRHYALLRPWFHVFPLLLVPPLVAIYDTALWVCTRKFPTRPVAFLCVSTVLVFVCLCVDPGKFVDWFMD